MIAFRILSLVWRQIDLLEMHPCLFINRPATCFALLEGVATATVAVGRIAANQRFASTARAENSFAQAVSAKQVSSISPAWDAGRAKRFAQFRCAKVSHFARHTAN